MPENKQLLNKKINPEKVITKIPVATSGLNQTGQPENQNHNHNTKKTALGPNTKR